jgi:hypothetical protein
METERHHQLTSPRRPGQLKMGGVVHALTADALRQYGGPHGVQTYPSPQFFDALYSPNPTPTPSGARASDAPLFQVPFRSQNYYQALPPIQPATNSFGSNQRSGANSVEPLRGGSKASALLRKFELDNSVMRWDQVCTSTLFFSPHGSSAPASVIMALQPEDQIVHWVRRENAEMLRRSQMRTAESGAAELARKYEYVKGQYLELATRVEVCCSSHLSSYCTPRIVNRIRPLLAEGRWRCPRDAR